MLAVYYATEPNIILIWQYLLTEELLLMASPSCMSASQRLYQKIYLQFKMHREPGVNFSASTFKIGYLNLPTVI